MRISDWSSDVCSSDLAKVERPALDPRRGVEVFDRDEQVSRLPPDRGRAVAIRIGDGAASLGFVPLADTGARPGGVPPLVDELRQRIGHDPLGDRTLVVAGRW